MEGTGARTGRQMKRDKSTDAGRGETLYDVGCCTDATSGWMCAWSSLVQMYRTDAPKYAGYITLEYAKREREEQRDLETRRERRQTDCD